MALATVSVTGCFGDGASPTAPTLPMQWSHGGQQTLAFPLPPWTGAAPVPRITTRMASAYDWEQKRMLETYYDMYATASRCRHRMPS